MILGFRNCKFPKSNLTSPMPPSSPFIQDQIPRTARRNLWVILSCSLTILHSRTIISYFHFHFHVIECYNPPCKLSRLQRNMLKENKSSNSEQLDPKKYSKFVSAGFMTNRIPNSFILQPKPSLYIFKSRTVFDIKFGSLK